MLEVKDLTVTVDGKRILQEVSLAFATGKTYFLLGRNGSGKSSLAMTMAGHPKYRISSGDIFIDGHPIGSIAPEERNRLGVFLSMQSIPEIPGIKLSEFLRTIYNHSFKAKDPLAKDITPFVFGRFIKPLLEELAIPQEMLSRDLNVGFSGGEKRKIELLQIRLLKPHYIILDEIDSGLDIDAFRIVAKSVASMRDGETAVIFITHNFNLMEYIDVDHVYVLEKGKLSDSGDRSLIERIRSHGYCDYCEVGEGNCPNTDKCA